MTQTYTGKNIDAAVAKAAKATGTSADDLNYEILAGKDGGFALIKVVAGAKVATQMVEKLSGDPSAPVDEREERPRGDRRERRGRGGHDRGDRGDRRDRRGRGDRDRGRGRGRGRDRDRDRGGRGRGRGRGRYDELLPVPEDGPTDVTLVAAEGAELGEVAAAALRVTTDILTAMGFGMSGTVSEAEQNVRVDLDGGVYHDALVAHDLEVLDALEHLVDKIANSDVDDHKKVVLDSQGVKAKADLDLGESARDMAARAIEEGRTIKLGPLDPRSRRIVHLTLREHEGVSTKSEGEGVFRRVCIIPRKKKQQAQVDGSHSAP